MKVFLRSIHNGLFYEKASKWTPDQKAALDFKTTARAVELVFSARLEDVEMLLSCDDPQFDLILPIERPAPTRGSSSRSDTMAKKSNLTRGHHRTGG